MAPAPPCLPAYNPFNLVVAVVVQSSSAVAYSSSPLLDGRVGRLNISNPTGRNLPHISPVQDLLGTRRFNDPIMAKPMAASYYCRTQPPISPSNRPRGRPHHTPKSFFAPSSGLLSILATIASSSGVDGSPAPPAFLCPSIDVDDQDVLKSKPSRRQVAPQDPTPLPRASTSRRSTRIPDKFVQGDDGIWRRASYTLYGSTVCPVSATVPLFLCLRLKSHMCFRIVRNLLPPSLTIRYRFLRRTQQLHQPPATTFATRCHQAGNL
jgi:hypothetical protein